MAEAELDRLHRRIAELEAEIAGLRPQGVDVSSPIAASTVHSIPVGRDELFIAVENTRMPMILTDPNQPDDPIIFANRAFQELSGYSGEELLGRNCRFLQGVDTDPAQVARIRQALADQQDIAVEILNRRRDGTPFVHVLYISPVFDRDGRLLYRFGSQLDVTGYHKDRRRLEATERQLRAIFDSAVDFAIIATGRDGRVTDWNAGAERILGWTAAEMCGETVDRFFTPEDRAADRAGTEMRLALAQGRASDERWHLKKDGSRLWASGELLPLRDEGGAHVGFTKMLRDRTAEHLAGKALEEVEVRLRRAQEAGGVGLFSVDLATNQLRPTPEFCRLYGLPVQEVYAAATVEALVVPGDAHLVSRAASRARGEYLRDVEYRIRRPDTGDVRWISRKGAIEHDADGHPVLFTGAARDITAQREAVDTLARTDERFRTILETIDAAFAIVEVKFDADDQPVDYRFVEANPAFERQAGVNLRGKWVTEFAPDLERFWFETYGHVAKTGEPATFENYAKAFERWFEVRAVRVGDPAERRIAIFFSDVTARRAAEERLRASEARERANAERVQLALAAGAIIGTWFWDLPTDRFTVDEAFARSFGLDPALGREGIPLAQIVATVHPDDQADLAEAINAAIARGGPYAHQYRTRRADGNYYWLEANGHVDHGPGGTPLRFPGVLIDVEERRATEAERDRAAAALRALAETLEQRVEERTRELRDAQDLARLALSSVGGVGAWTYDVASDRYFCSSAIAELYGVDPIQAEHGISRRDFLVNVHPDDLTQLKLSLANELERSGGFELQYRIRHPDGRTRWLLSRGHTYIDDASRPVRRIGVGIEMTRQRELEEQLRQSQKMEAVGQLTGGLAHDFNNLLTGITGSLELLGTRIMQGRYTDLNRYIGAAQGAAGRAAALTHRLLAFSRRQTLDPKPTDVNRLVADMEELVRRTVGPAVAVEVVGAAGLWTTLVDPNQLENAVLNLCINARDAMPEGGRLTIETANRWLDPRAAHERDVPPGQYVSLCVSDTGTGMPPDVIAKAFDPFFTTKPLGQGTGLGLSMIYGFVRQSGGQARIYSEPGQGAMVCLYLPRHLGDADLPAAMPDLADAPRAEQGETVLVVDDEPTVRMLVMEVLEELGYAAIEAADGPSGLRVLQSDARVDLLVTDVGLPGGMNGRQMADAARVGRPDLKVMFITGYAENAVVGNGHLEPGMHVMTKPFAMEALATRIKELIAGA